MEMKAFEIVVANSDREDIAYLLGADTIDFEIGGNNNFEIKIARELAQKAGIEVGAFLYIPGTEWGGIVEEVSSNVDDSAVTFNGSTWRGLLAKSVIEPPAGQDYLVVSGDIRSILRQLIVGAADSRACFTVPNGFADISVTSWIVDRYATALETIEKMLAFVGRRIDIDVRPGFPFAVVIEEAPIVDHSQDDEYSQDNPAPGGIKVTRYAGGVNHLICLGQGELRDRLVMHLYVMNDGSIQQSGTPYFAGEAMRTEIYDCSGAKDAADLFKSGQEKLDELRSRDSFELIGYDDHDYPIGDIIGGRDFETGICAVASVTGKILRIESGKAPEIRISIGKVSQSSRWKGGESNGASGGDGKYRVGDICISTLPYPPNYGTWEAWGTGRMPIGINPSDADFNTVGKTGGAKTVTLSLAQIPSHAHTFTPRVGWVNTTPTNATAKVTTTVSTGTGGGMYIDSGNATANTSTAGSGAEHSIMPPYITCYYFKRTA